MRYDCVDIRDVFMKRCSVCCKVEKKTMMLVTMANEEKRPFAITDLKVMLIILYRLCSLYLGMQDL